MNYRIVHKTRYDYAHTVGLCHNKAWILPRKTPHQTCLKSMIAIHPDPAAISERMDFFDNRVTYFVIQQPHDHLHVTATSETHIAAHMPVVPEQSIAWDRVRERLLSETDDESIMARYFMMDSPLVTTGPGMGDYARDIFPAGRPALEAAYALMERIHHDFDYVPGFTNITTPLDQVMRRRRGVCQDFAHVAIACLRTMGLPARYVSGYLETIPPPGKPRLVGADASHAWFAVYAPPIGWVDFDPTNNLMPENRHITIAWGRDFTDVTPLKGVVFGSGSHRLSVSVDVAPVGEQAN